MLEHGVEQDRGVPDEKPLLFSLRPLLLPLTSLHNSMKANPTPRTYPILGPHVVDFVLEPQQLESWRRVDRVSMLCKVMNNFGDPGPSLELFSRATEPPEVSS